MAMRIFFEYSNTVVQLPVNPPSLAVECAGNNTAVEIVSLGEINVLRDKKLRTVKIECFFPAKTNKHAPYVLTQGRFEGPQFYISFFEGVRTDKKPVRLIITDTDINMEVAIESFKYSWEAGDDDVSYTLELKEYRANTVRTVTIQPAATPTAPTQPAVSTPQRAPAGFAIGDEVTANGNYWYSSYGAEPHGTFNNFRGKISHIVADSSRKYRFHITTLSGGYRGWVAESQIKH